MPFSGPSTATPHSSVLPSILGKLNVKSPLATPKEPVEDDGTRKKKEPPL